MGYLKINSKIRDIAEKEIIMLQKIIEITAETLGAEAESITENTSFTEDLHADSLDLFELAMALEDSKRRSGKNNNRRRCGSIPGRE